MEIRRRVIHPLFICIPYDTVAFIPRRNNLAIVWKGNCMVRAILARDTGQGLVEYGLVLVLIMVVVVAIVSLIGDRVSGMYTSINSGLSS